MAKLNYTIPMLQYAMLSVANPLIMCSFLYKICQLYGTHIQWKSDIKVSRQLWYTEQWVSWKPARTLAMCGYCKKKSFEFSTGISLVRV